ncbi:MAG: CusA/CzcA family heavy metal efflux RND transporter [Raineya sp.]|jgi:cobalt-zinc-cadmium resistance protein CzcA|nr:CusA/CzcA family heavy metal efflux RND transporter [Raineya sp.]
MLDNIIGFSIRNKIIVGVAVLVLIIWGSYSLTQIPIDAVPDITNNQVQVITQSPQFSAQEVEQFITAPLEMSFANLQYVEEIRSISRFGLSVITIVFKEEMDIYLARQLITEKIKLAEKDIPSSMGQPFLAPVSTGLGEIYQYVIRPKKGYEKQYNSQDLRTIQDWIVKRRLAGTEGVVEVSSFGGNIKQYEVAIKTEQLRAYELTINEIFDALHKNNENTGGSYIEKQGQAYFIRAEGFIKNLSDIENIVVKNMSNRMPVLIKDVAQVHFGNAIRYGAMTQDGKGEVVGGIVMMLKGANSAQVISKVKERILQIQKTLPEGLVIEPFLDRTHLVDKAIFTVSENLALGGLIVVFVLILFLGNLRAGFVVASVIPLALLFTLAMMNLFGISANLMSLGAIDFGLVVDGAVIIVEAILHYLHAHPPTNLSENHGLGYRLTQQEMNDHVFSAAKKIRQSAAFGEIIILMVYLPIWSLSGVEGKMFKPMAQAVSFAILGAFILSLTYVPMMSSWALSKNISLKPNFSDKMMSKIAKVYQPVILWVLRKKAIVLAITIISLVASFILFTRLGGEFIPQLDEGDFAIETRLKSGASLSETIRISTEAEKILLKFPEVKTVVSKIGSSEIPTDPMPIEANDLMVVLKDKSEWRTAETKEELAEKMNKALKESILGVNFDFQQPIQMRFNELMTGVKSDIALKIYGDNLDILTKKADQTSRLLRKIKGIVDIKVEQVLGLPQILIQYNRAKIAQYGLNIEQLNQVMRTSFAGEVAGVVFEGEKRFDVVIRLEQSQRNQLENLKNLYVKDINGTQIRLEEVAKISYQPAPVQVSRENTKRRIVIGANVRGRDVESVVKDMQAIFEQKKVKLPVGYYVEYGGQFENLEKGKQRLMIAVPIALGLIFLLLYFTFHSIKQAILIFTAIPLSAIGGVVALWFRDMPFSISAGVGFIALFGVAVLNGIVLIGYFNHLQKEGYKNVHRRVLIGVFVRLRPVLMTASVASLGFLPMAISSSAGAEVQRPLATVVIGGLLSATFLTLIVLPILYIIFEQKLSIMKKLSKNTLMLICFVFSSQIVLGQKVVSLNQALEIAEKQSLVLQTKNLEVTYQKASKPAFFKPAKTLFEFQYGQINILTKRDYSFQVTQMFSSPKAYLEQKKLAQSKIDYSQKDFEWQKKQLSYEIKKLYYEGLVLNKKIELLKNKKLMYEKLVKSAKVKHETGETHLLDKISAETYFKEIIQQINASEMEVIQHQYALALLLNVEESVTWDTATHFKLNILDTTKMGNENMWVNLWKMQKDIASQETKVAKANRQPDWKLAYYGMSIENVSLAQVYQLGFALPLFNKGYKADIQASKVKERMAEVEYLYQKQIYNIEVKTLLAEIEKQMFILEHYEKDALLQADLIFQNVGKSYQLGEIDYTTFVQNSLQAWQIQTNYLDEVNLYNQAILRLELLKP